MTNPIANLHSTHVGTLKRLMADFTAEGILRVTSVRNLKRLAKQLA